MEEFMPQTFKEYKTDLKGKAACERYFEKIIEAAIDLAFIVIKEERYRNPEDDKEALDILAGEGIISSKLSGKLRDAKGMRNIIAHEYGKIDDEVVFHSITEELSRDVKEFIKAVQEKFRRSL